MQFNESHHNMTPENGSGARDGGGFDCDLGSEDCLIAYNWSHDNEGEGFLLMQWPIGFGYQRGDSHDMHVRYNIGERDAKKLAGAIEIFGGPNPVFIHNNTIYYEPDRLDAERGCRPRLKLRELCRLPGNRLRRAGAQRRFARRFTSSLRNSKSISVVGLASVVRLLDRAKSVDAEATRPIDETFYIVPMATGQRPTSFCRCSG
jgi:hypothetical protein